MVQSQLLPGQVCLSLFLQTACCSSRVWFSLPTFLFFSWVSTCVISKNMCMITFLLPVLVFALSCPAIDHSVFLVQLRLALAN